MKKLFLTIFFLFIMSQALMAEDQDAAQDLVRCKLDAVISVLKEKDLSKDDKNSRIVDIVSPMFDFPRMAKLTLGKRYWPALSKEQKKRFTDLFVQRLKESYRNKLVMYTDEEVVYEASLKVDNKVHVPTYLISKENKISILYKLYKPGNNWKIYDIEVQGVSLIQTYRSQFNEILQTGTVDDLLAKLAEPVDS